MCDILLWLTDRRLDRFAVVVDGPDGEADTGAHQRERDLAARGLEERSPAGGARDRVPGFGAERLADASTCAARGRQAGEFPRPRLAAAVSPAAHGTAAAPSASVTLSPRAAARLINRLTVTSSVGGVPP